MPITLTRLILGAAVIGWLALPAVAQAQSYEYGGPRSDVTQWHFGAGFSDISAGASNYLDDGWLVNGGFSYFPQAGALGVRGDLSYSSYAANGNYSGYGPGRFGPGYGDISSAAIGGVARLPGNAWAHVYGLAQVGVSYVQLHSDQYFYGPGGVCSPYYGPCGYGYGNTYDTSHLSWNLGVGVEIPLYWGPNLFVEAQYRQIQTPSPIEYWPITVGLRF
jgi:hypothetical protein